MTKLFHSVYMILLLALMLAAVALTADSAIAGPRLPLLKMLSTSNCPACAQMTKVLDEINKNYKGKLATERVDLEQHQDIARKYNIRYVPTLLFLDSDGKEIAQKIGYMSLGDVLRVFRSAGVKI